MDQPAFRISFEGRIGRNQNPLAVISRLALLFNVEEARIRALFTGRRVIIKRGLDYSSAVMYRNALQSAGACCRIEPDRNVNGSKPPATGDFLLLNGHTCKLPSSLIRCPRCGHMATTRRDGLVAEGRCPVCGILSRRPSEAETDVCKPADEAWEFLDGQGRIFFRTRGIDETIRAVVSGRITLNTRCRQGRDSYPVRFKNSRLFHCNDVLKKQFFPYSHIRHRGQVCGIAAALSLVIFIFTPWLIYSFLEARSTTEAVRRTPLVLDIAMWSAGYILAGAVLVGIFTILGNAFGHFVGLWRVPRMGIPPENLAEKPVSTYAALSLTLGVLGLVTLIPSIPGAMMSHAALKEVRRGFRSGRRHVVLSIVINYWNLFVLLVIAALIFGRIRL